MKDPRDQGRGAVGLLVKDPRDQGGITLRADIPPTAAYLQSVYNCGLLCCDMTLCVTGLSLAWSKVKCEMVRHV